MLVFASLLISSGSTKQAGAAWQNFAKNRNPVAGTAKPAPAKDKGSPDSKSNQWTKEGLKPGGELGSKVPAVVVKKAADKAVLADYLTIMNPQAQDRLVKAMEAAAKRTLIGEPIGLGMLGALGGTGVQAVRRALHTDEEKPKPSLLNGALLGGVLGVGTGGVMGMAHAPRAMYEVYNGSPLGRVSPLTYEQFLERGLQGIKKSNVSPMDAALRLGLLGAGGGLAFQGIRKLLQSKKEEEEEGSPSLLKGLLLGGLLGAGAGGGLAHWMNRGFKESPPQAMALGNDVAAAAPSSYELPAESLQAAMTQASPQVTRNASPIGPKVDALRDAGKASISPKFSPGQSLNPNLSLEDLASMQSVVGPNGEFKLGEFTAPRTLSGNSPVSTNNIPMDFPMFHRG